MLAGGGERGPAGVGGVEVGDPVGVCLRLTENGPRLVLQHGLAEFHLGEQGGYAVGAFRIGDPSLAPVLNPQGGPGKSGKTPDEGFFTVDELQVEVPTRTRYGADPLKRAPQVRGAVHRAPGIPDFFQGLGGFERIWAFDPDGVAGPAEAVGLYRKQPGVEAELPAPEPYGRAGDGGAPGAQGNPGIVPGPDGVYQAGKLRAVDPVGAPVGGGGLGS